MRWKLIRDPLFGVLTLAAAAGILYLGQRPPGTIPRPRIRFHHADKIAHFIMYFGFASLTLRARRGRGNRSPLNTGDVLVVILTTGIVGAADEIWQYYADRGRSGDVMDWVADVSGAGAVLAITAWRGRPTESPTTTTSNAPDSTPSPG